MWMSRLLERTDYVFDRGSWEQRLWTLVDGLKFLGEPGMGVEMCAPAEGLYRLGRCCKWLW